MIPQTRTAVVHTKAEDAARAGTELGERIRTELDGSSPDALILFVSPKYEAKTLLEAVQAACTPAIMVGCSSAGEFTSETAGDGFACAVGICSSTMKFAAGLGLHLSRGSKAAAQSIAAAFHGIEELPGGYSAALVLTDALAGHADELIEQLTLCTGGNHQFFGGGAGDDANFRRTQVFLGTEVVSDAAVALEILSPKPIGVGVRHGWYPASKPMRVTEADGMRLISLNSMPAAEAFHAHAHSTTQTLDPSGPIPFFLHNILGVESSEGYKLRVPLTLEADGSVICAAEIPVGASVCIMSTDPSSTKEAAANATKAALAQLNGSKAEVALFFDCVATRLRMGREFDDELSVLRDLLGATPFLGCNTYGQVARTEGQFSGFHNCTAVVCVFAA
jgi:hypothetical protein